MQLAMRYAKGSSPRMRGALAGWSGHMDVMGIIPAEAGSTESRCSWQGHDQDHPRGCGEHCAGTDPDGYSAGSSPRMRGAQKVVASKPEFEGIIPADAGSTHRCRSR